MSAFAATDIQTVRDYWNRRPCNVRHSTAAIGTRRYFDEVAERKYRVEPHIPGFAAFDQWRGKRVLEIGCGIGTDTISFARAGAIVTAVDYSEESLALAERRAAVYGLSNVRFLHANAETLSTVLPVETYDLVYSFGVIHHTPCPERAVAELRRYMGPESVLKLMVYHRWSYKVLAMIVRSGGRGLADLDRLVARHSEAQTGCPVTYSYSPRTVRRLLAGFAIQAIAIEHIFPYKISDYVRHRYTKLWCFRVMPRALFRLLERRLGWHLCVTARLGTEPEVAAASPGEALT